MALLTHSAQQGSCTPHPPTHTAAPSGARGKGKGKRKGTPPELGLTWEAGVAAPPGADRGQQQNPGPSLGRPQTSPGTEPHGHDRLAGRIARPQ